MRDLLNLYNLLRMSKNYKYNQNDKATVCSRNHSVTVYGDTARIVNGIAVTATALIALALLAKALR